MFRGARGEAKTFNQVQAELGEEREIQGPLS